MAVGIDARLGQPVPQQIGVQREWKDAREDQGRGPAPAPLVHQASQGPGGSRALGHGLRVRGSHPSGEGIRNGDGAAVLVQGHGRDQGRALAAQAQARGQGHRGQHVRPVQEPSLHLVADGGPGGLAHQFDVETFVPEQAQLLRHRQGRAVGQRDETKPQMLADHGALPFSTSA